MPAWRREAGSSSYFARSLMMGAGSELPQRNTMRWICDFPRKGMMPQEMGAVTPADSAASRKR